MKTAELLHIERIIFMATLITKPGTTPGYMIQWYDGKKRHTLYLGGKRYNSKTAERVKDVIETLVYCRYNNITVLDKATTAWIQNAHESIRCKLAQAGLITLPKNYTCQQLWTAFFKDKTDAKASTTTLYQACEKKFFLVFKPNELLEAVTHDRLVLWKTNLLKKYSEASVATYIKLLKAVFNWAIAAKWITESPAARIPTGSFINRENDRFITLNEYQCLLDHCPSPEWRRIIALARMGGLRCPSELTPLKWSDIDWDKNRFYVTSPKTARHKGKEQRTVPLFSPLRQELEKCENKEGNVIPSVPLSLYGSFQRIAVAAGIGEIDRPFDNMRMSRSNEVLAQWGPIKESLWIGHSQKTMQMHYLLLVDNDYSEAAQEIHC
jgi:integrase